jgi:hypothetical protein
MITDQNPRCDYVESDYGTQVLVQTPSGSFMKIAFRVQFTKALFLPHESSRDPLEVSPVILSLWARLSLFGTDSAQARPVTRTGPPNKSRLKPAKNRPKKKGSPVGTDEPVLIRAGL